MASAPNPSPLSQVVRNGLTDGWWLDPPRPHMLKLQNLGRRGVLQLEVARRRLARHLQGRRRRPDVDAREPGEQRVVVAEGDPPGAEALHLLEHSS